MSLASIKRNLKAGAKVVMVRHDWYPAGKLMGVERAVIRVQSNGVQFEGGSWLYFKAAKEYRDTTNGFQVCLDGSGTFDKVMEYQFVTDASTCGNCGETVWKDGTCGCRRVYALSIGAWGTIINTRTGEEFGGTIHTLRLDDQNLTPDGLLYCRPQEITFTDIWPK